MQKQNIELSNLENHTPTKGKLHLKYLDGLRGLAALYVLLVHIDPVITPGMEAEFPLWFSLFLKFLRHGVFSVVIFIALSGYGLMLSVARSQTGFINGGLANYFQRRCRRILPPYYITLGFCILIASVVFIVERVSDFRWDKVAANAPFNPHFSIWDVFTHLLLIHNLSSDTYHAINPPLWSIGTEWQLYFLFPFVVLPIWRKFGLGLTVFTGLAIGLIPVYLFNNALDSAAPWFIGIFCFGIAAADIGFSQKPHLIKLRQIVPWGSATVVCTILAFVTEWRRLGLHVWIGQTFLGLACACLFVFCTNLVLQSKPLPRILQIFEHPWTIGLGSFSYSLYLIHGPVLALVRYFLFSFNLPSLTFAIAFFVLGTGFSLAIGYLFFLVFERPFMHKVSKNTATCT